MDVRADGPYEVGSLVFLSPEGTCVFTVIAKATFVLTPELSPLLTSGGDPVLLRDVPWGDGPGWSLRACSDLVPFKQSPELLLSGSAYSAGGKPVRAAVARVAFGTIDKSVEVQGDRYFAPGGVLSEAAPWTRMPLVWERAAGGPETINPVGIPTGRGAVTDARGRTYLPNLWPPWTTLSGPHEELAPVCFGPLSPDWPERVQRLSSRVAWELPLPADFDGAYFNASPEDQRLAEITGAETLVLTHLHPRHARLVTRLAPATPVAVIDTPGEGPVTIDLACDTLWIDTDRGIATMTFRGHAAVGDPAMPGTFFVRSRPPQPDRGPTLRAGDSTSPPRPHDSAPPPRPPEEQRPSATLHGKRARQVTLEVAMPGAPLPPAWERFGSPALPPQAPNLAQTPFLAPAPAAVAQTANLAQTPFVAPAPVAVAQTANLAQTPFVAPAPAATSTLGPEDTHDDRQTLPGPELAQPTMAQALHARIQQSPGVLLSEAPPEPAFVPLPTAASEPVAPPPLWSGDEETDRAPDTSRTPHDPETPALPAALLPAPPATPPGPPPLPVSAYPLARCAALAASIDRLPDEAHAILDKASLDDDTWERLTAHYDLAIENELRRHRNKLLREYDAAYVARLEEERGPVAASDYARLAAADEVKAIDPVLEELKIPVAAWPRLRRVWIQLTAKDRKLAALVQSFLEDERSR